MREDWANNKKNDNNENAAKGDNKRVILINGGGSKWYEQAIFIVRRDCLQKDIPNDFIVEAERIVSNYMNGMNTKNSVPSIISSGGITKSGIATKTKYATTSKRNLNFTLNIIMFICCAVLLALFCSAYIL